MVNVADTFRSVDQLNEILDDLHVCISQKQIEDVFSHNNINDPEDKKALLHRCMGIEEYRNSPIDSLSPEDEYIYAVSVFLEGSWRLLVNG